MTGMEAVPSITVSAVALPPPAKVSLGMMIAMGPGFCSELVLQCG